MKKIYLAIIGILFCFNSFGQFAQGCDGKRYVLDLFPTATKATIQYATNKNVLGENQKLYMDVYTPDGDTVSQRPVIIWAYGGSFISGGKGDMESYCRAFAKKGYVTAAIDYRLWPLFTLGFPTGPEVLNVVIQAVSDMRGSVRYFRKDADKGNDFKIDPGNIILAGISAGAITALHAANLDAQDSVPPFIQTAINNNGGIGGNTGDSLMLTYPYDCKAVINLSGGLYNAKWLDANSPPFVSYHGNADAVVP
ncbi:MAG TPA: alpha/beta hydrolase, partial [Saprospiraceae bacterium]|nr:alpha/beta hydrolase [Saprospiraceae bacterium]